MRTDTWHELSRGRWAFDRPPEVDEACRLVAGRMKRAGFEDLLPFFASLVFRFARWTWNLPASERHHHAFPFGLLIHGIETVERAVAVGAPTLRPFAPPWQMATLAFALYHDCGRLFDVEVSDPSGRVWNPLEEPLTDFCGPGPTRFAWRPGRGLDRHEYRNRLLFPRLLPEGYGGQVLKPLDDAAYAYVHRDRLPLDILGLTPVCVAGIVSWADQRSAKADHHRRQKAALKVPAPGGHAPVCYYSPNPETRGDGR